MRVLDTGNTADNIRQLMIASNIPVKDVAERLAVTLQAVYRWLNGESMPTLDNLVALSGILKCSLDDIVAYKNLI